MSRLRDSAVRLVNLFRRERIERELDAELQAYLELDVEENIRRGMAPKEARRMALARLGGAEMVKGRMPRRTAFPCRRGSLAGPALRRTHDAEASRLQRDCDHRACARHRGQQCDLQHHQRDAAETVADPPAWRAGRGLRGADDRTGRLPCLLVPQLPGPAGAGSRVRQPGRAQTDPGRDRRWRGHAAGIRRRRHGELLRDLRRAARVGPGVHRGGRAARSQPPRGDSEPRLLGSRGAAAGRSGGDDSRERRAADHRGGSGGRVHRLVRAVSAGGMASARVVRNRGHPSLRLAHRFTPRARQLHAHGEGSTRAGSFGRIGRPRAGGDRRSTLPGLSGDQRGLDAASRPRCRGCSCRPPGPLPMASSPRCPPWCWGWPGWCC